MTIVKRLALWNPTTWNDIRTCWDELVPESRAIQQQITRNFQALSLNSVDAGHVFERWVLETLRLGGVSGHWSYSVQRSSGLQALEQVDGLVFEGYQGFLIESKFLSRNVDFGPIAQLHVCVEQRPIGTLGLLFSAFGFTDPALELSSALRPIRVLLFNQNDLLWVLESRDRVKEMLRRKWRLAVRDGCSFSDVTTHLDLFGDN